MNKVGILIKYNIMCFLGSFRGKKGNRTERSVAIIAVLAYLGILAIFTAQSYLLFEESFLLGMPEIAILNNFQTVFMFLILFAFQQMTTRNTTNDSDLLLSLPIRKIDIVLSKTIYKYLFYVVMASIIMLPTIVLYEVMIGFSLIPIIMGLIIMLVMPIGTIGLNYIVNYFLTRFFNKSKYANLIKTILVTIIFIGVMGLYMYSSISVGSASSIFINKVFLALVGTFIKGDILPLVYLILFMLGLFVIGVILFSTTYGKAYEGYASKVKIGNYKSRRFLDGLFAKEFKRYITTPVFVFNTIISPILLAVITVFAIIKGEGLIYLLGLDSNTIMLIFTFISMFLATMTLITCALVSLEGKSMWILKSSPINVSKILFAKSLLGIVIFTPFHIVTTITMSLALKCNIAYTIFALLIPLIVNATLSFSGTYINLLVPKFDWENEAQIVKQSMSVLFTMLLGMLITIIPVILFICGLSFALLFIIIGVVLTLILILSILLLFTHGVKRFNSIQI